MRSLLTIITFLAAVPCVNSGDYCYRNRNTVYGYGYADNNYSYTYHKAGYWNNRYYEAGYYYWHPGGYWYKQNYGPHYGYDKVKVVYKEVEPDFYASVNSFYRDALFADAVAYRVLTAQKQGAVPTQPAQPLPPYGAEKEQPRRTQAVPVRTAVSPVLASYVSENCLKCHNGPGGKGGVDLSSLETLPVGVRWACHGTVSAGEMPKGGKEAPDAIVKELFDYAKSGSVALQQSKVQARRDSE